MKSILLCMALLFGSAQAHVSEPPDPYAKARAIIADLDRITAPSGVQDAYKTTIGGVPQ